jgi:hypothetical protein
MEARTSSERATRSRRRVLAAILLGIALGVIAFFVVRALAGGDDDERNLEGPDGSFTLSYPAGWDRLSNEELEKLPGSPLAAVREENRKGIVVISGQAQVTRNLDDLSRQLRRQLKKELPDFRQVSSGRVTIEAGPAFSYTYVRRRRGTVHNVVAVPVNSGGYTLNSAVQGGDEDAARQAGAIIRSFDA